MDIVEKLSLIIIPILIAAFLTSVITRNHKEREKFNDAATIFRNKLFNALEGIYPVTRPWWDESLFPKFQQSVPIIETVVVEFRHLVKRKTAFDAAIKKYRDYCQCRTYEKGAPHFTYPNSPAPPNPATGPIEEFKNIVEHLLSFANEK